MKQVLYFTADWCQPCQSIKPMMHDLQSQMSITVINVDASAETAKTWNVRNIPTVLVIQNGMQLGRLTGTSITREAVINLYNR
jgi:thioredoxin 1